MTLKIMIERRVVGYHTIVVNVKKRDTTASETREIRFTTTERNLRNNRNGQRRNHQIKDDVCREIGFVVNEQSASKERVSDDLWIADSAATCHMGPNFNGCSEIRMVSEKVKVGNGKCVNITAREVYQGILCEKDFSKKAIKLDNYACCPGVTKRLL